MALIPEVAKYYGKLKHYINGEWVESGIGQYFEDTNPANDEVIAHAPVASREQVEQAIAGAYEAFKNSATCRFVTGHSMFLIYEMHYDRILNICARFLFRIMDEPMTRPLELSSAV